MQRDDADDRPIVYLAHGLLGSAHAHFGGQIRAWTGRLRVVPLDLPGHGRCPVDAGEEYLQDAFDYVVAAITRFGPGRVVAASQLGAPLAVRCAIERPELVTSVVLTGFAPGLDREIFLGLLAGFPTLAARSPALVAEYEKLHGTRWRETLAAFTDDAQRAFERRVQVTAEMVGALTMPVFILNGSYKSVERAAAENAGRLGPHVRGQVISGAGHIASHDAPEEFNAAVQEFWATVHTASSRRVLATADVRPS